MRERIMKSLGYRYGRFISIGNRKSFDFAQDGELVEPFPIQQNSFARPHFPLNLLRGNEDCANFSSKYKGKLVRAKASAYFVKRHRKLWKGGFTLVEVLISSMVLILAVSGILLSYLRCLELNEFSRNSSLAVQAAKSRMEQIKFTAYDQIKANFDRVTFTVANLNGMGVSYVDDTNSRFLQITTSVSWQQKNNRMYGEDLNLNGVTDIGEDVNGNGILDSPVLLVSRTFQR